jgi:hypothetical protein
LQRSTLPMYINVNFSSNLVYEHMALGDLVQLVSKIIHDEYFNLIELG